MTMEFNRKFVKLNPKNVRPGPVGSLSTEQSDRARRLWERVQDCYAGMKTVSFEQFETGFARDTNPDDEIALMEKIADAVDLYCERFPRSEKQTVYCAMMALSILRGPKCKDAKRLKKKYPGIITAYREAGATFKPITVRWVGG